MPKGIPITFEGEGIRLDEKLVSIVYIDKVCYWFEWENGFLCEGSSAISDFKLSRTGV
jgi:hypothetical protein